MGRSKEYLYPSLNTNTGYKRRKTILFSIYSSIDNEKETCVFGNYRKLYKDAYLSEKSLLIFLDFFENSLDLELTPSSTLISVLETLYYFLQIAARIGG